MNAYEKKGGEKVTGDLRYCEDCGRYFVRFHHCRESGEKEGVLKETQEGRERLRERDKRAEQTSGDDTVLFLHGRPDTAYHNPKDTDIERTQCGTTPNGDKVFDNATRAKMWKSNHFPCRHCHPHV